MLKWSHPMSLTALLNTDLPLIQAPMAGSQDHRLAAAVCQAGGLGSIPCAMLTPAALRQELQAMRELTERPFNLNFFSHVPPEPDAAREAGWRETLAPYYDELGVDPASIAGGPGRLPFNAEAAALVEEFRPAVVSFHFGLPQPDLLERVRRSGAKILSSATTLDEALWLQERGVDAVIAQGLEAGGHRGHFLDFDLSRQLGFLRPAAATGRCPRRTSDRRRRHQRCPWRDRSHGPRRRWRAGRQCLSVVPGSHDQRPAPRSTAEPCGAPYRTDQPVQRSPGTRHRQSPDARAGASEHAGASLPPGHCGHRSVARGGRGAGQRRLFTAVGRAERRKLPAHACSRADP